MSSKKIVNKKVEFSIAPRPPSISEAPLTSELDLELNLGAHPLGRKNRQVYKTPRNVQKRITAVRKVLEKRDHAELGDKGYVGDSIVGYGDTPSTTPTGGKASSSSSSSSPFKTSTPIKNGPQPPGSRTLSALRVVRGLTSQTMVKLHGIASSTMARGEYKEARTVITGIARRTPGGAEVYRALACLHEAMFSDSSLSPSVRLGAGEKWYLTKRVEAGIMKKDWRIWAGAGYAALKQGKWKEEEFEEEEDEEEKGDTLTPISWFLTSLGDFEVALKFVRRGRAGWQECKLGIAEALTRMVIVKYNKRNEDIEQRKRMKKADKRVSLKSSLPVVHDEDGFEVYGEVWDETDWRIGRRRNMMEKDKGSIENLTVLGVVRSEGGEEKIYRDILPSELAWEWCMGSPSSTKGHIEVRKRSRRHARGGRNTQEEGEEEDKEEDEEEDEGLKMIRVNSTEYNEGAKGYEEYIESKSFTGSKKGWVFKTGPYGLGYYVDYTNPSKPSYFDHSYHLRCLKLQETNTGSVDREGRVRVARMNAIYEKRRKMYEEVQGGKLVKNLLPKGSVKEAIIKTEEYSWELIREGEYSHCLNVIQWGREFLRRRYARAKEMKGEYDGKIKAVKKQMWDEDAKRGADKEEPKVKDYVLGILKEDDEDDEGWGFDDDNLLLGMDDEESDGKDFGAEEIMEACKVGAMGPAIDGMEGICQVGAGKGVVVGAENLRQWLEWMDMGLYKKGFLGRSEISYQIARACQSKGVYAGTIAREVVEGLRGGKDLWQEAAKAILQVEGVQGLGEDDGEEEFDYIVEIGEDEIASIEKLSLEWSGWCIFTPTSYESIVTSPLNAARLKAFITGAKWILDECWMDEFGARIQRSCKKMCEDFLRKSNWKVKGEKKNEGQNWEQGSHGKREFQFHHLLRSLLSEGCGGKEDARILIIYEKLSSAMTPPTREGWKRWEEDVNLGGRELLNEPKRDEIGDDIVSLFVIYAESIAMREDTSGFGDAIAIVTGYIEARSGVKVWEVKGDVHEMMEGEDTDTMKRTTRKRKYGRDSFGVTTLSSVGGTPKKRLGLEVSFVSPENGARIVCKVIGSEGTGNGQHAIIKDAEGNKYKARANTLQLLSEIPKNRKAGPQPGWKQRRKLVKMEKMEKERVEKEMDRYIIDDDVEEEEGEEEEEEERDDDLDDDMVLDSDEDDVVGRDDDVGKEGCEFGLDIEETLVMKAKEDISIFFTRDEISEKDLLLKLEHLRIQKPRTKVVKGRILASIIMLARGIHDENVKWAASGLLQATRSVGLGRTNWGMSKKWIRVIFEAEGILFPMEGKELNVGRRNKRNVGFNVALCLLAMVGKTLEWEGWKGVAGAVNWDMEGEGGEWIRRTGGEEGLLSLEEFG